MQKKRWIGLILFFTLGIPLMSGCQRDGFDGFSIAAFNTQFIDVIRRDDVEGLEALHEQYRIFPFELSDSHRSCVSLAIEFNAEKCLKYILECQAGSWPCTAHDILARLPYLNQKLLRVDVLRQIVGENIFVKKMVIQEGQIKYYTFLELYEAVEREVWLTALGEARYNEYLGELKEASAFRLNYLLQVHEERRRRNTK